MLTGVLTIAAPVALALLVLAFVVARRALRLFVKLAIVSVLALVLLCGYVWWRWQGSTASAPTHNRQTAPARR